jgi:hypothetical protein
MQAIRNNFQPGEQYTGFLKTCGVRDIWLFLWEKKRQNLALYMSIAQPRVITLLTKLIWLFQVKDLSCLCPIDSK